MANKKTTQKYGKNGLIDGCNKGETGSKLNMMNVNYHHDHVQKERDRKKDNFRKFINNLRMR